MSGSTFGTFIGTSFARFTVGVRAVETFTTEVGVSNFSFWGGGAFNTTGRSTVSVTF
jgi:hypothetical protein